jgi:hypothetical protein
LNAPRRIQEYASLLESDGLEGVFRQEAIFWPIAAKILIAAYRWLP